MEIHKQCKMENNNYNLMKLSFHLKASDATE